MSAPAIPEWERTPEERTAMAALARAQFPRLSLTDLRGVAVALGLGSVEAVRVVPDELLYENLLQRAERAGVLQLLHETVDALATSNGVGTI